MYSREYKERVLAEYHASGLSVPGACTQIPWFPSDESLRAWLRLEEAGELHPAEIEVRGRAEGRRRHRRYGEATKREALRLLGRGMRACDVARRLGVSSGNVVRDWARRAAGGGSMARGGGARGAAAGKGCGEMAKRAAGAEPEQTDWRDWAADLPEDPAERMAAMERKYIEMGAVLDVLKAPGPGSLSNMEKHRAGEMARARGVRLVDVCRDLGIPKSTYEAQPAIAAKPDKYAALRVRVRASFEASMRRYGSESICADLRRPAADGKRAVKAAALEPGDMETPVVVSEKVVRRIMSDEGLVPVTARQARRRFSSYAGELEERPGNLTLRGDGTHDFHADGPFDLVVTDVTEFNPGGRFKCYLSPAIDCHDGDPIAWTISRHPDAELTGAMLTAAADKAGHGFTGHTDGGCCYMGEVWKGICAERGIVRSMSRKGRSPDNARAEGFFGTLKREFYYCRDWTGVTYEEFAAELDAYIVWYRDVKIKKSLGWKSIREYREERGWVV